MLRSRHGRKGVNHGQIGDTRDRAASRTGGRSWPVGSGAGCPSGRSAGRRASTRPTFYWWRRKFDQADHQTPAFLPVHVLTERPRRPDTVASRSSSPTAILFSVVSSCSVTATTRSSISARRARAVTVRHVIPLPIIIRDRRPARGRAIFRAASEIEEADIPPAFDQAVHACCNEIAINVSHKRTIRVHGRERLRFGGRCRQGSIPTRIPENAPVQHATKDGPASSIR